MARSRLLALLALAFGAGLAGAAVAVALAGAFGAFDGSTTVERVVEPVDEPSAPVSLPARAAGAFDAERIYAVRAPGVVTLEARFANGDESTGSGFVVDARRGLVLTNSHVVTDSASAASPKDVDTASSVFVELASGERATGKVRGYDLFDDIAVVEVDPSAAKLVALPLGSSRSVSVGEPVAAIGSPFREAGSLSVGVVSQIGRSIPTPAGVCFQTSDAVQTDAAINHGNSGGPLLDARGRVIGVNAQIDTTSDGGQGVGFAIPVDAAKRSLEGLVDHGRVRYAWLGVATVPVTPGLGRTFDLGVRSGALVSTVTGASAAEEAGLQRGRRVAEYQGRRVHPDADVIVGLGDRAVASVDDLQAAVAAHDPGDRVAVRFVRDGRERSVDVTLKERPLTPQGGCASLG